MPSLVLTHHTPLTHDVYELTYRHDGMSISPGQYLLCDCDVKNPKLRRSYSVSWSDHNHVQLIIKKLSDGTGGSRAICEQAIGHTMQVWGPLGRFVLRDTPREKIFIGTGTGFAPLYCMMKTLIEKDFAGKIQFVFGVREARDIFYQDRLSQWSQRENFAYQILCSREKKKTQQYNIGRVTDHIPIADAEYYICGNPAMVRDVRDILKEHAIPEECIFFEQY